MGNGRSTRQVENLVALLAQITGIHVLGSCRRCAEGNGPFIECYTNLRRADGSEIKSCTSNACANCTYQGEARHYRWPALFPLPQSGQAQVAPVQVVALQQVVPAQTAPVQIAPQHGPPAPAPPVQAMADEEGEDGDINVTMEDDGGVFGNNDDVEVESPSRDIDDETRAPEPEAEQQAEANDDIQRQPSREVGTELANSSRSGVAQAEAPRQVRIRRLPRYRSIRYLDHPMLQRRGATHRVDHSQPYSPSWYLSNN